MMLLMFVVFTRYSCRAHPVVPHIPATGVYARIRHAKPRRLNGGRKMTRGGMSGEVWAWGQIVRLEYRIYYLVNNLVEILFLDTAEATGHVALNVACNNLALHETWLRVLHR